MGKPMNENETNLSEKRADILRGKTALVTGASRGIGRAIALALAEEGMRVAVHYCERAEEAEETCRQARARGGEARAFQADLARSGEAEALVQAVESGLGPALVLVNNAGVVHRDALENLTEADWDRVLDVNLKSAFLVTQACLPAMRARRWGRIVNLSSVAAQNGGVTGPIYVASKAGLIGLTRSYASLLAKEEITANAIAPALIETDMTRSLGVTPDPIPVGRLGRVEEVADVAVLLAKNGYLTGQTINVNGGWVYS